MFNLNGKIIELTSHEELAQAFIKIYNYYEQKLKADRHLKMMDPIKYAKYINKLKHLKFNFKPKLSIEGVIKMFVFFRKFLKTYKYLEDNYKPKLIQDTTFEEVYDDREERFEKLDAFYEIKALMPSEKDYDMLYETFPIEMREYIKVHKVYVLINRYRIEELAEEFRKLICSKSKKNSTHFFGMQPKTDFILDKPKNCIIQNIETPIFHSKSPFYFQHFNNGISKKIIDKFNSVHYVKPVKFDKEFEIIGRPVKFYQCIGGKYRLLSIQDPHSILRKNSPFMLGYNKVSNVEFLKHRLNTINIKSLYRVQKDYIKLSNILASIQSIDKFFDVLLNEFKTDNKLINEEMRLLADVEKRILEKKIRSYKETKSTKDIILTDKSDIYSNMSDKYKMLNLYIKNLAV